MKDENLNEGFLNFGSEHFAQNSQAKEPMNGINQQTPFLSSGEQNNQGQEKEANQEHQSASSIEPKQNEPATDVKKHDTRQVASYPKISHGSGIGGQNHYQTQVSNPILPNSQEQDPATNIPDILANQEEILRQLKSHDSSIAKFKTELEQIVAEQANHDVQERLDKIVEGMHTNFLYLSKLEKKYEASNALQGIEHVLEPLLSLMETNNLYLSKLERKVLELEEAQQANAQADWLEQLKNNALQLSKIEQRISEISQMNQDSEASAKEATLQQVEQKLDAMLTNNGYIAELEGKILELEEAQQAQQANAQADWLEHVKNNTLQLSKIEQRISEISEMNQDSEASTEEATLQQIEQKLDAMLTNNGYIAELEGKILELEEAQQANAQADWLKHVKNNALQLSKIEQRVSEISQMNQDSETSAEEAALQQIEQKLDAVLADKIEEKLEEKLNELQQKIADWNATQKNENAPNVLDSMKTSLANASDRLSGIEQKILSLVANNQDFEGLVNNPHPGHLTNIEQQIVALVEQLSARGDVN